MILLYDEQQVRPDVVSGAMKNLMNCQKQMGMETKEIVKYAVPGIRDAHQFQKALERIVQKYRGPNNAVNDNMADLFFIMVVNRESDYKGIKEIFTDLNVLSQCIRRFTCQRMNMSVASNIMKQINSKLGGESVRIKLPRFMSASKVMVVGMDVCHASKNSIVGFVASTNPACTSFYQDIICQAKGQEIVKKDLDRVYGNALEQFRHVNGDYPDKIIVLRDGVGDAMRLQVIENEIKQLRTVLDKIIGHDALPKITLVVVNKRIN